MDADSSQQNDSWVPSYRLDWSYWKSEGHIDVYLHVEGVSMDHFRYAYAWQDPNGSAFGVTGINHSPAFAFFAPYEA